jgi:hypothetical protein
MLWVERAQPRVEPIERLRSPVPFNVRQQLHITFRRRSISRMSTQRSAKSHPTDLVDDGQADTSLLRPDVLKLEDRLSQLRLVGERTNPEIHHLMHTPPEKESMGLKVLKRLLHLSAIGRPADRWKGTRLPASLSLTQRCPPLLPRTGTDPGRTP